MEVECPKSYKIISTSSSAINMKLYNSNMNLMSTSNEIITLYLSPGIYYLDLSFIDDSSSGDINTSFGLVWVHNGWDVSYNTNNDVLTHLHEIGPNVYKNKLQYYNNEGAGFYIFTLTGTKANGSLVYYPEGAITIYSNSNSNRSTILNKLAEFSNEAKTSEHENSMTVYLPRNGYFYIDINMDLNNLETLYLDITSVSSNEINLFNLPESADETITIFSESSKIDYFEKVIINQLSSYTISTIYDGDQVEYIIFVLLKLNYNASNNTYALETIIEESINGSENNTSNDKILDAGIYYVGYINKKDNIPFTTKFTRHVILSGAHILTTDPEVGALCGSQINIIEMNESIKSYRETYITKNFTRILYPNYNYIYQTSSSRLDYHWYSSNENIATVTAYGTVLGKNIGTVKIMAVLKEDPSKVFVKEFTIINDTGTEPIIVNSTYTVKFFETDNGTFKLNLEKINCPYPWFQDYTWSLFIPEQYNDLIVDIDVWGNTNINKTGSFELTGTYLKNSRVTVKIAVIIEP